MDLQHINIKVFASSGAKIDLAKVNRVFHEWIQNGPGEELLIDVADYAHVPAGPGMMVIGHHANYSLDYVLEERPGLLYNRKTILSGENTDRLRDALQRAFAACDRLERHALTAGLRFNRQDLLVVINDRALIANDEGVFQRVKPDFDAVFGDVFADAHRLEFVNGDPRDRFTVRVTATREPAVV